MSVEKVTQTKYRCICELSDCPGKKKPWLSGDALIPERCRWCGRRTWNGQDLRRKSLLTAKGRTQEVSVWAKETGLSRQTIRARIKAGWNPEDAVSLLPGAAGRK
jgi:hypothetical protein